MILLKKLEKEEQTKHKANRNKETINASPGTNKMELLHSTREKLKHLFSRQRQQTIKHLKHNLHNLPY